MNNTNDPGIGRDYTDEEIRSFVGDLESLRSGELTVSLLVGCGARAIPPLRDYLLDGQPRGIFQPRQRAVEALAQLGAKDVLFEYLSQTRDIPDAVVRFGEEAVENTAARELSRWLTEDVYQFVLHLAQQRMRVGLIETLGEFERPDSASVLIHALGDGVCRAAAEAALHENAKSALLEAVQRKAVKEEEKPPERQRRRAAMRILSEISLTEEDWSALRPLLHDEDKEVALTAAMLVVDSGPAADKLEAARFLIRSLDGAHWFLQSRIEDCLHRNYSVVREQIAEESDLRRRTVKGEPLADPVLRILEMLRSRGPKER